MDLDWGGVRDTVAALALPLGMATTWLAGLGSRQARNRIEQLEQEIRNERAAAKDDRQIFRGDMRRRLAALEGNREDHGNRIRNLEKVTGNLLRERRGEV